MIETRFTPEQVRRVRRRLLRWFGRSARDLPWRRTGDPYSVWVAEVMLQQTQVQTVIPYYQRFLERFSSVHELGAAPIDDVLKLWAGLGYYRRARLLHTAARLVVDDHGGRLPQSVEALQQLPGIGRYTAGAIASIAFGEPVPVVDGNVMRVLCRLFALRGDPKQNPLNRQLWALAGDLVSRRSPGRFNQALMELGSNVCTTESPACGVCPVQSECAAWRRGVVGQLPESSPRQKTVRITEMGAVVRRNGRVLVAQRREGGLWGGLWEFPHVMLQAGDQPHQSLAWMLRESFGLTVEVGAVLCDVRHGVTFRRIHLTVYDCRCTAGRLRPTEHAAAHWVRATELETLALSAPQQKIARALTC